MSEGFSPHRAVLWVRGEVYPVLPTGECSPEASHKAEVFPVYFDGRTKGEAIEKLDQFISKVKRDAQTNP
jgi:hypothetical protein